MENITAQEWINKCGAGINFGNHIDAVVNFDYREFRRWYSVGIKALNGTTTTTSFNPSSNVKVEKVVASCKIPTFVEETDTDTVLTFSFVFNNTYMNTSATKLSFNVSACTIEELNGEYECESVFTNKSCKCVVTLTEAKWKENSGKTISMTITPNFPQVADDDTEALTKWNTLPQNVLGCGVLNEYYFKAAYAQGYRSVRIPFSTTNHRNPVTNVIDQSFLEYIAKYVDLCLELGFNVLLNLHADDDVTTGGYLVNNLYMDDVNMQNTLKSVWQQVGTYFADRSSKLAFCGFNETLNDLGWWDNAPDESIYGMVQMFKDFREVIRGISGNEHRVLIANPYACKNYAVSQQYTYNNTTSTWLAEMKALNDEYIAGQVHIYSNDFAYNKQLIDEMYNSKFPFIVGEWGFTTSGYDKETNVNSLGCVINYAHYRNIPYFLWDDGGNMKFFDYSYAKEDTYLNIKAWKGFDLNAVTRFVKSANPTLEKVVTSDRLINHISGDKFNLYLDTSYGYKLISLKGNSGIVDNTITCSTVGEYEVGAFDSDGHYNIFAYSVSKPTHFIEDTITLVEKTSDLKTGGYLTYLSQNINNNYNANDYHRYLSGSSMCAYIPNIISVQGSSKITITTSLRINNWDTKLLVVEYSSTGSIITRHGDTDKNNSSASYTFTTNVNTKYLGVSIIIGYGWGSSVSSISGSVILKTKARDMNYNDYPMEDRECMPKDYSLYDIKLRRKISIIGDIEYTLNFANNDVLVNIEEYNEKDELLVTHKNFSANDKFKTKPFTSNIIIEFCIPNLSYIDLIKSIKNDDLNLCLTYRDYIEHEDILLKETCPDINIGNLPDYSNIKFPTHNGKLLRYNGKIII